MVKVTIAVAVYNVEKYVGKCITSVLDQDFTDYEILVVDDRGTDDSISRIEDLAKSHPRGEIVRIVRHEKNTGTGGVRNTCIAEARGEYLFFMDGDDYLAPNAIRLLYETMMARPVDIVMGSHQMTLPDGSLGRMYRYSCCIESPYAIARWMQENHTNYYPVATWNKLFRTSFLRENKIICVPWHRQEDIFFALQTALVVKSICAIPEITYYWLQVEGSCTHQEATPWHLKQYLDIFDKSMSLLDEKEKQTEGKYPREICWILTNRFLGGFMTRNICTSNLLKKKQKTAYLKHLRKIACHIRLRDEFNWRQKLLYMAIMLPFSYHTIKFLLAIRKLRLKRI